MNTALEMWKFVLDGGLLIGVGYLVYQFSRTRGPDIDFGRLASLEEIIRQLIRDADEAARTLNDQLLRRQQNLERLLLDLQSAEEKINRALTSADAKSGEIDILIRRVERVKSAASPAPRPSDPHPEAFVRDTAVEVAPQVPVKPIVMPEAPEPPSFESVIRPAVRAPRHARSAADERPLHERVETIIEENPFEPIRNVEVKAREALVNGEELVRSAAAQRPQPATQEPEDPRLGVLGGIKRQTQVI